MNRTLSVTNKLANVVYVLVLLDVSLKISLSSLIRKTHEHADLFLCEVVSSLETLQLQSNCSVTRLVLSINSILQSRTTPEACNWRWNKTNNDNPSPRLAFSTRQKTFRPHPNRNMRFLIRACAVVAAAWSHHHNRGKWQTVTTESTTKIVWKI